MLMPNRLSMLVKGRAAGLTGGLQTGQVRLELRAGLVAVVDSARYSRVRVAGRRLYEIAAACSPPPARGSADSVRSPEVVSRGFPVSS